MASMRRMRLYGFLAFLAIVTFIYFRSSSAETRSSDFYESTKNALNRKHDEHQAHDLKDTANLKAPAPKPLKGANVADLPVDRNVAGRKKTKYPIESEEQKVVVTESTEEHDVTVELNSIMKRSPIIIFSKSYCPHSKRAKGILLEKYDIVPKPYVVELDEHPMGALLQDKLERMTGRRTVPNVLVSGKSIGGGDDVAELATLRTLAEKLKSMAGKQMQKIELRPEAAGETHF